MIIFSSGAENCAKNFLYCNSQWRGWCACKCLSLQQKCNEQRTMGETAKHQKSDRERKREREKGQTRSINSLPGNHFYVVNLFANLFNAHLYSTSYIASEQSAKCTHPYRTLAVIILWYCEWQQKRRGAASTISAIDAVNIEIMAQVHKNDFESSTKMLGIKMMCMFTSFVAPSHTHTHQWANCRLLNAMQTTTTTTTTKGEKERQKAKFHEANWLKMKKNLHFRWIAWIAWIARSIQTWFRCMAKSFDLPLDFSSTSFSSFSSFCPHRMLMRL